MHRIVIPIVDGMPLFEVATPCEVFGRSRADFPVPSWYEVRLCAGHAGQVRTPEGFVLDTPYGLEELADADTIIVPPRSDIHRELPEELLEALREAHERGVRTASICTGAFILAAAGLLDGKRATTHWLYADEFASRYPEVKLDPDVLYTDEDGILTSAGVAAGLDLCLHIVRQDLGAKVANRLARRMVMPPHRDGGQAQYIDRAMPAGNDATNLAEVLDWARAHLDEPLTVEVLAARAAMSPRTFARQFRATTGTTPLQWLLNQRVRLAQELLETTDDTVDRIATRCGFGSAHQLRIHFVRFHRVTPHQFRRTFTERALPV